MRLSRYFLPLLRETPSEAQIVSHRLMLRAGMIRQEAAGIYAWLPLGFRVLQKIEQIVREEMDRAGAIEILMPTLQPSDLWKETGRYDAYGPEMLRIKDRHERELLYGPTNEDMVTEIFRAYVKSYKALPLNLYHIQWKFRDEVRPRFGVMRGREFLMKDAYSFDIDKEAARRSYNRMYVAYLRAFTRMGLTTIPMRAETARSAAISATSSSCWPRPARAKCSATRTCSTCRCRARMSISTAISNPSCASAPNSTPRRRTSMMRRGLRPSARRQAGLRARHRGRPYLLFRHEVFRADEGDRHRPGRQGRADPWRLLRRRRVASGGRDHRGEP